VDLLDRSKAVDGIGLPTHRKGGQACEAVRHDTPAGRSTLSGGIVGLPSRTATRGEIWGRYQAGSKSEDAG
jgi:hypothetical protein